jgi:hypothetical protein
MFDFNPAFLLLWTSWLVLCAVISGIGLAVFALLKVPALGRREWLLAFWVGMAASTFFLQIWHLFQPVNALASGLLGAVGVVGLLIYRSSFPALLHQLPRYWLALALLVGLSLWVASRAANAEVFADDAIYHIPEMMWIEAYPIVHGLGNVQGRLAFNNAYTLPLAAIDVVPGLETVIRLGNSLVMMVFLGQVLLSLNRLVLDKRAAPFDYVLAFTFIPFLIKMHHASSIKNDLIVSFLSLILAGILFEALQHRGRNRQESLFMVAVAALLCCFGIAIKLSFIVYGILTFAILLLVMLRQTESASFRLRLLVVTVVIFAGYLGVWALRGIILSGYPAFPSTAFALPVPWRVPEVLTRAEADLVYSWARAPYADSATVLASWEWFSGWFDDFRNNLMDAMLPLLLLLLGSLTAFTKRTNRVQVPWRIIFLFMLPVVAALVFWFIFAPVLRFGWQYFWLLGGGMFAFVLWNIRRTSLLRAVVVTLIILFSFDMVLQSGGKYGHLRFMPFRADGQLTPVEEPEALYLYTSYHGVDMRVAEDEYCLMAELPCAIEEQPYLKLRVPGDLGAGFEYQEVESDNGAFDLRHVNPSNDIGPDWASELLHRGVLPPNGILVGNGWHGLEQSGDEQYRWADNDVEIFITEPAEAVARLLLEIEPGPSLGGDTLRLSVVNEAGEVVAEAEVDTRERVLLEFPLPPARVQIFRLHAESESIPAPGDGRILNFRVLGIEWADTTP